MVNSGYRSRGGRPPILRRNDWLGPQGVLRGTHGYSWVLSGYIPSSIIRKFGLDRQAEFS